MHALTSLFSDVSNIGLYLVRKNPRDEQESSE